MEESLLKKIGSVLEEILKSKKLSLFALLQRVDSELWDIVVAGEKLDSQENLVWVSGLVNKTLERSEVIKFSRLLMLNSDDVFVKSMVNSFSFTTNGSTMRLQNVNINNIYLRDVYLLYSRKIT